MPYRVLLWLIWARLGATRDDAPGGYASPEEFTADLEVIASSLAANRGAHAGLDVRQDAGVHRAAVAALLGERGFAEMPPAQRLARLLEALDRPATGSPVEDGEPTLAVLRAVGEARRRFGREAIGPYILSMAQGADDVLAMLVLARRAGLVDDTGRVDLDVAPLFETVDDLEQAGATLAELLALPAYCEHLAGRGDRQVVMLGYSDSSKISGIAASRWALYRAQEDLVAAAAAAGVDLTLFHGRGGTVGRGGSKPREAVLAEPCGAVRGRLRVTEQGEIVNAKYGLRGIAERTLELVAGGVLEATACADRRVAPPPAFRATMATVAEAATSAYRATVEHPDFVPYFRTATPIDAIERLPIGSRPASRRAGGGVEMVLAKAHLEIAARYADLAEEVGAQVFPGLAERFRHTVALLLELRGECEPLTLEPVLARSIRLRNPYVDPMSLLQVDLLRRWRAGNRRDSDLERALFTTVRGIARGLQNTG